MQTSKFKGKDFLALLNFTPEDIRYFLEVAEDLKRRTALGEPHRLLQDKTLFMLFFNQSLRTRNSFTVGMSQLGGHAIDLTPGPQSIYTPALEGEEVAYSTERISDVARVLASFGDAIAIRMYGDPVQWIYGKAHMILEEFAKWSDKPVINMEDDMYHPCQGLADILTIKEKLGTFKGKKFVMSWAYSPSVHKPMAVPQSAVIATTMMGMDVVIAHPHGMELDPMINEKAKEFAKMTGGSYTIEYDMKKAFEDADVVYPKAWCSLENIPNLQNYKTKKPNLEATQKLFDQNKHWICDEKMLKNAKPDALYMHCLPADRGFEVTNEVMDGPQSVIFDQAENRLHAQKAIMALMMR